MPTPARYARQAEFTGHSASSPGIPQSGVSLDAEYNAIRRTLDQILDYLDISLASDGSLKDNTISRSKLDDELQGALSADGGRVITALPNYPNSAGNYVLNYERGATSGISLSWQAAPTGTGVGLANDSVRSVHIVDGGIFSDDLADDLITTVKLRDFAVTNTKIANGAIDGPKIAFESVATACIADSAITNPKLAGGAVTADKIANSAISSLQIASGAVNTAELADLAVDTAKLSSAAVTTDKLANAAVTNQKVKDGTLTEDKLAAALRTKIDTAGATKSTFTTVASGLTDNATWTELTFSGVPAGASFAYVRLDNGTALQNVQTADNAAGTQSAIWSMGASERTMAWVPLDNDARAWVRPSSTGGLDIRLFGYA